MAAIRKAKASARESSAEIQLRKALDLLPQMLWSTLPDGHADYHNRQWYAFTGTPEGSTFGEAWNDLLHPDDQDRAWQCWSRSVATGEPHEVEFRLRHHSGDYRWVLARGVPERNEQGEILRWYGSCTDIHDRIRAVEALRISQTFQQNVLDASADCITVLSAGGTIELMNAPGYRAMELDDLDALRDRHWVSVWPPAARKAARHALDEARAGRVARFTGFCPTARKTPKWWDVVLSPMVDDSGNVVGLVAISRDMTALKESSDQLTWLSEHDVLTSLPNRRAFQARLLAATLRAKAAGRSTGLLLLDIDHFKHVNDTLGHAAGDHLLQTFAERLKSSIRSTDFVARLGGDEFAVIVENVVNGDTLVEIGTAILARLSLPVQFDGRVITGSASIGGALFPLDSTNADELLKNADTALYALKATGRGGTRMFQTYMREEAQKSASQLSLARIAVNHGSVVPYYQPKVDLRTGMAAGFEALLRWRHPSRGIQDPDTVAEAFKDYELASKIGELMQDKVFADLASWRRAGTPVGPVSVNAAPAEFLRDDYAPRFLDRLHDHKVPPELLEVEVTEHVFFDRTADFVGRALKQLKDGGVRISLDDFGTGYSSLSHLRDFPVDVVKIDRSFVAQIAHDPQIAAIVRAVIDLAHSLSIEVIAEGVETPEQRDLLRVMGCDLGQGWLFGRPASRDDVSPSFPRAA